MKIEAKRFPQTITADLQYTNGKPSERRYDSCYYEISPDANSLKDIKSYGFTDDKILLHLEITKSTEMNIYVYGGADRNSAMDPIVIGNAALTPAQNYTIEYTKGMFLVAYPNENQPTEFEFKYWV